MSTHKMHRDEPTEREPHHPVETREAMDTREAVETHDERVARGPTNGHGRGGELLDAETAAEMRSDWNRVKLQFVDAPEAAVEDAARICGAAIDAVGDRLRAECDDILSGPEIRDASTEELRSRLQRYEALLGRLGVHAAR